MRPKPLPPARRPGPTRREAVAGLAATAALAGCAAPFPTKLAETQYPPIGEFAEAEGLLVHLWRRAPEDPERAARTPVVLIHGASGNLRDWTFSIAPRLAAHRPVIAVDRPGFGYTERPAVDGWHPRTQARVLRAAIEGLGHERVLVLGHSLGAAVAMAWAIDAPGRVAGVVPVSGVTMPYRGFGRVLDALGLAGLVTWAYTEYIKSTLDDGGVQDFLGRAFEPQPVPEGYAGYVGAPLALRERTLAANRADLRYVNGALDEIARAYPSLGVPAEIVHGAADFIDADGQSVRLHATLPRSRLTLLPQVGHMAHHAAPEVLIAALDRLDDGALG